MSGLFAGVASAVVGIGSGIAQSEQSRKAARAQVQGQQAGIDEQRRQYDLTREDQAPWRAAGVNALGRLNDASTGNVKSFFTSPDYNFRRTEGQRGIQQSAAAGGGLFSGNALRRLSEFNSNLAGSELGNWWDRQAGLAGVGQRATETTAAVGARSADNISGLYAGIGDSRASGIIGGANALAGGINNGLQTGLGVYNAFRENKAVS